MPTSGAQTARSRHRQFLGQAGACHAPIPARGQTARGDGASAVKPDDASGRHSGKIERETQQVAQWPAQVAVAMVATRRGDTADSDTCQTVTPEAAREIDIFHQRQWRKAADRVVEGA